MITLTQTQHSTLLDVARVTIRTALGEGFWPMPHSDDPALHQPAGCFVSIHEKDNHRLRGCMGRLDASTPILQAVRETASSVLNDPRFVNYPIRLEELPLLDLELSILSPLQPAASPLEFDLQNDGVFLVCMQRSGCFLPQVARETGWSKEQLLDRLCSEKLGLPPHMWRTDQARLFTFQNTIIGPAGF